MIRKEKSPSEACIARAIPRIGMSMCSKNLLPLSLFWINTLSFDQQTSIYWKADEKGQHPMKNEKNSEACIGKDIIPSFDGIF